MSDQLQDDKAEIQFCQDHLNIEFTELCYYPTGRKVKQSAQTPILKNISGNFYSGRLTALVGPSGSGKTSLLNVLSGFKTVGVTGSITANGRERNVQRFRKQSCYITQEFALMAMLTTKETLSIAADLKLDSSVGKKRKNEMVNQILELLGLEKVTDVFVQNISGGEKKRLSIGLELLTNPPIMFFDEPTSGLDSSSALQVVSHLKSLAQGGRTIVCSIHQPSSRLFEMFDDLYLITEGQCLYSGPISNLTDFLAEVGFRCPNFYNRADFIIEVANGERGDYVENLIAKFSNRNYISLDDQQDGDNEETSILNTIAKINETAVKVYNENEPNMESSYHQTTWKQFQILLKRSLLCSMRDKLTVQIRIIVHVLVGILLGAVYYDTGNDASKVISNIACIFFFNLFLAFANAMPSLAAIPLETSVFLREHSNNWYSLKAYYLSKLVADIPLQFVCPTMFLLVAYFLTDQPSDGTRFLQFWLICLLLTLIGHNLGLSTGAISPKLEISMFLMPASNIPLVLFSGFFLSLPDVSSWLRWLTYISYFRYAFEGSMLAIYGNNRPPMSCAEPYCYFKAPRKVMEQFHIEESVFTYDIIGLVIWAISLQIALLFALKWRIYKSQ